MIASIAVAQLPSTPLSPAVELDASSVYPTPTIRVLAEASDSLSAVAVVLRDTCARTERCVPTAIKVDGDTLTAALEVPRSNIDAYMRSVSSISTLTTEEHSAASTVTEDFLRQKRLAVDERARLHRATFLVTRLPSQQMVEAEAELSAIDALLARATSGATLVRVDLVITAAPIWFALLHTRNWPWWAVGSIGVLSLAGFGMWTRAIRPSRVFANVIHPVSVPAEVPSWSLEPTPAETAVATLQQFAEEGVYVVETQVPATSIKQTVEDPLPVISTEIISKIIDDRIRELSSHHNQSLMVTIAAASQILESRKAIAPSQSSEHHNLLRAALLRLARLH